MKRLYLLMFLIFSCIHSIVYTDDFKYVDVKKNGKHVAIFNLIHPELLEKDNLNKEGVLLHIKKVLKEVENSKDITSIIVNLDDSLSFNGSELSEIVYHLNLIAKKKKVALYATYYDLNTLSVLSGLNAKIYMYHFGLLDVHIDNSIMATCDQNMLNKIKAKEKYIMIGDDKSVFSEAYKNEDKILEFFKTQANFKKKMLMKNRPDINLDITNDQLFLKSEDAIKYKFIDGVVNNVWSLAEDFIKQDKAEKFVTYNKLDIVYDSDRKKQAWYERIFGFKKTDIQEVDVLVDKDKQLYYDIIQRRLFKLFRGGFYIDHAYYKSII